MIISPSMFSVASPKSQGIAVSTSITKADLISSKAQKAIANFQQSPLQNGFEFKVKYDQEQLSEEEPISSALCELYEDQDSKGDQDFIRAIHYLETSGSEEQLLDSAKIFFKRKNEELLILCYEKILSIEGCSVKDKVSYDLGNLYRDKQGDAIDKKADKKVIIALTTEMLKHYQTFISNSWVNAPLVQDLLYSSFNREDLNESDRKFYCQFYAESLDDYFKAEKIILIESLGGHLLVATTNDSEVENKYASVNKEILQEMKQMTMNFATYLKSAKYIEKEEEIPYVASDRGACTGMIINMMSLLCQNKALTLKSALIEVAAAFRSRSGPRSVVIQSLYINLMHFFARLEKLSGIFKSACLQLEKTGVTPPDLDDDEGVRLLITNIISFEVTRILYETLGLTYHHIWEKASTDEDLLKLWMKQPDGYYHISISTESYGHALLLAKKKEAVFLIDPNVGLIDCREDPNGFISKLLKKKYGDVNCHNIQFGSIQLGIAAKAEGVQACGAGP